MNAQVIAELFAWIVLACFVAWIMYKIFVAWIMYKIYEKEKRSDNKKE